MKKTTDMSFWSDWDSLNPFADLNWRDFCFIKLSVEFQDGEFKEFHVCMIGLHFFVNRVEHLF